MKSVAGNLEYVFFVFQFLRNQACLAVKDVISNTYSTSGKSYYIYIYRPIYRLVNVESFFSLIFINLAL
jgi:hypothetical protein